MSDHASKIGAKFEKLVQIMAELRGEQGCPWDQEQTHQSLTKYLVEEAYEVLEAIDENNDDALREELGDLLLQVVFHAQIASENKIFDIAKIIDAISEKLVRRHPNVFGDVKIKTAEEQSINWERLKKQEGKESILDGVPKALSALLRAHRLQQKASTVGFDWPVEEPVWQKVLEEVEELKNAHQKESKERVKEELGDLLFSLVNLSRFLDINPEDALRKTSEKFIRRFKGLEREFELKGEEISEATLEELDAVWEKQKELEKK